LVDGHSGLKGTTEEAEKIATRVCQGILTFKAQTEERRGQRVVSENFIAEFLGE
jgi:hypothetical protein